jgi:hypothetical protein
VPAGTDVEAAPGTGLAEAARTDAGSSAQGVGGSQHHSDEAPAGTLLWAEAADGGWRAKAAGQQLTRSAAFDWTNAFALPDRASVGIRYRASLGTRLLVLLETALWIVAIVVWQRTCPVRRRSRGARV